MKEDYTVSTDNGLDLAPGSGHGVGGSSGSALSKRATLKW